MNERATDPAPGVVRLIADDLTGALDAAVHFAGERPINVHWKPDTSSHGRSVALDIMTREIAPDLAARAAAAAAGHLDHCDLAFHKIDSLLRGHPAAELAALVATGRFDQVLLAPALPAQNRCTRAGRQYVLNDHGGSEPLPVDLMADLRRCGLDCVVVSKPDQISGCTTVVRLCDAATDRDLEDIAAAGMALSGKTLWSGTSGLARALAYGAPPRVPTAELLPLLAIVGSCHPVAVTQLNVLRSCGMAVTEIDPFEAPDPGAITGQLESAGYAVLWPRFREPLCSQLAQEAVTACMAELLPQLPRPAALFASGGETLRSLCAIIGAEQLDVLGELMPGTPVTSTNTELWSRVLIISKSGAFGDRSALADLIAMARAM